ncbi:MAG: MBL fold metallo-hydrolase [Gammaproteobacteria bacterium]|jgi:metallo-beta-lactamase class B|nr:MBL fold metallo-hydrolase [Gammaproteobacteria bacterium]MDP7454970.1 MBL fold metallo-hydrolase [Gammaproteobacteria bacterium]|tara:strand:+ start:2297 stop:3148 length:852 start_codon:yes stop_codon:yes gene_type:complete
MKLQVVSAGVLASVVCLFSTLALAQQELSQRDDPEFQRVEPFQVFDNLYYVGAQWVSAWVLETDQGLILFNALYGDLTDIAIDGIRELGMDPDDIRYVVVTHAHYDHIGGARRIQEEFGATMLMTQEDWDMAEGEPIYQAYPKPVKHLVAADGATLRLGRTFMTFFHTPGHTPGVLSIRFTVYDQGYPHTAFMFGGVGLNFSGVERTQMYIDSVKRLMTMDDIEVNVPNHAGSGQVFERNIQLLQRRASQPHPFVDPEGFKSWLAELLFNAEAKLADEQAAAR